MPSSVWTRSQSRFERSAIRTVSSRVIFMGDPSRILDDAGGQQRLEAFVEMPAHEVRCAPGVAGDDRLGELDVEDIHGAAFLVTRPAPPADRPGLPHDALKGADGQHEDGRP